MTGLASIQEKMALTIQAGGEVPGLEEVVVAGALSQKQRLQIYQNNFRQSLVATLREMYPITEMYVGVDFLAQALRAFIRENSPQKPMLHLYGGGFPEFLADCPAAETVPYITDLARLEWAVHRLQFTAEERSQNHGYSFSLSHEVIASAYPLLNLWLVGTKQLPPEAVSLQSGGQTVVAFLKGRSVRFVTITAEEEANFTSVKSGATLEAKHLEPLIEKGLVWKVMDRNDQ